MFVTAGIFAAGGQDVFLFENALRNRGCAGCRRHGGIAVVAFLLPAEGKFIASCAQHDFDRAVFARGILLVRQLGLTQGFLVGSRRQFLFAHPADGVPAEVVATVAIADAGFIVVGQVVGGVFVLKLFYKRQIFFKNLNIRLAFLKNRFAACRIEVDFVDLLGPAFFHDRFFLTAVPSFLFGRFRHRRPQAVPCVVGLIDVFGVEAAYFGFAVVVVNIQPGVMICTAVAGGGPLGRPFGRFRRRCSRAGGGSSATASAAWRPGR